MSLVASGLEGTLAQLLADCVGLPSPTVSALHVGKIAR